MSLISKIFRQPTVAKETKTKTEYVTPEFKDSILHEFEFNAIAKVNSRSRVTELAMQNSKHCTRMPNHKVNANQLQITRNEHKVTEDVGSPDPTPPETSYLPAVISKELRASGITNVKWTRLSDLPSHGDDFIRQLGKKVFEGFEIDPDAEVYTICCFRNNPLLNEVMELNSVLGFLDKFAEKPYGDTVGVHSFGNIIEDYAPLVKAYHSKDKCYLSVYEPDGQGFEGHYLYMFKLKK